MSRWPRDDQKELIKFYGVPNGKGPRGVAAQLVKIVPPFQFYYEGAALRTITCHIKVSSDLSAILAEIWEAYGHSQEALDAEGFTDFGGAYNPRKVRGSSTKWSNHAFGAAFDFDAKDNGLNQKGDMPDKIVDIFKRHGWRWGGDYKGRKDPMHFEAVFNGEDELAYAADAAPSIVAFGDFSEDVDLSARRKVAETAADDEPTDPPKTVEPSPLAAIARQAGGVVLPGLGITGREVNNAVKDAATQAIQHNYGKIDLADIGGQLLTNGWFWLGVIVVGVGAYALWVRFGERTAKKAGA